MGNPFAEGPDMSSERPSQNQPAHGLSVQSAVQPGAQNGETEIDLLELLNVLLSNLRWIIAAVLIGALGAFFYTQYFVVPMYRSTGKLYVVSSQDSVINLSDFQVGNYLASDYEKVVYTWEVLEQTKENLSLPYTQEQMRRMITVNNPQNTRILEITVQSRSPREAALIANELMLVVSKYVVDVMETEQPNILSEAQIPLERFSPSKTRNTMLGAVLGGFVSVLAIFIIFMLDDKIKTPDDILKHTGMPTLSIVPRTAAKALPGAKVPPVKAAPNRRRVKRKEAK